MKWIIYLSVFTVLIAYLSSLRSYRLGLIPVFRNFSVFLLLVLLGEIFGIAWSRYLYRHTVFTRGNQWFYIWFHFLQFLFYLYFFYSVSKSRRWKRWISIVVLLFVLFSLTDYTFLHGPWQLNTWAEMLGSLLMVICSIAYYRQLLMAHVYVPLRNDTPFWVATGVLIYNLGSILGTLLINTMYRHSEKEAGNIHLIILISAILMYLTFTTGFLCRKKQ